MLWHPWSRAIEFLLEIRVLTMILEGDSKIVIKSLENEEESIVLMDTWSQVQSWL